tara:strand:+ start:1078 stop:1269 length:192 start_codon:yes stop_codon:yes gene_type:complete
MAKNLKLEKQEAINGDVSYFIWHGASVVLVTSNIEEALIKFEEFKNRIKDGFPKTSLVLSYGE